MGWWDGPAAGLGPFAGNGQATGDAASKPAAHKLAGDKRATALCDLDRRLQRVLLEVRTGTWLRNSYDSFD